jgi:hypothetical protein
MGHGERKAGSLAPKVLLHRHKRNHGKLANKSPQPVLGSSSSQGGCRYLRPFYDKFLISSSFCYLQICSNPSVQRVELAIAPSSPSHNKIARLDLSRGFCAFYNMASQQILFAETIAGMKKAFKRKAYGKDPKA